MKNPYKRGQQYFPEPHPSGGGLARLVPRTAALLIAFTAYTCLTGCSFRKPAHSPTRHFVLTPLPAPGLTSAAPGALGVCLGQVKIPAYLLNTSLGVRKGTNEIYYLSGALWAERLDTGIQNVLAANLRSLLSTGQI